MNSPLIRGMRSPIRASMRTAQPQAVSPFDFAMGLSAIQQVAKELEDLKRKYETDHQAFLQDAQQDHEERMAQLDTHLERLSQITPDSIKEILIPLIPDPVPGEDGEDGNDAPPVDEAAIVKRVLSQIRQPKDGETPVIDEEAIAKKAARLIKVKPPENGKDAVIDHEKLAAVVLKKITEDKLLNKDHIQGLSEEIASYRNQLAGKHYGSTTMVRGGGDTVVAGSNITISTSNGVKTISSAGGATLNPQTPSGTVNGVNVTFTITGTLNALFVNGQFMTPGGVDYTLAGTTITFVTAPPTNSVIYAI